MLVLHPDGRSVVLDGHSHGPASLSRKTVSRAEQRYGFRACTVPSLPAILGSAVRRFGSIAPVRNRGRPPAESGRAGRSRDAAAAPPHSVVPGGAIPKPVFCHSCIDRYSATNIT